MTNVFLPYVYFSSSGMNYFCRCFSLGSISSHRSPYGGIRQQLPELLKMAVPVLKADNIHASAIQRGQYFRQLLMKSLLFEC
ncbi:hypothetical protein D3C81_1807810 [compost metagenome]